jgi:chitin disaccharide deacetylase
VPIQSRSVQAIQLHDSSEWDGAARDAAWRRVDRLSEVVRLIVNADDFGLTRGVNRAIAELHDAGLLTSSTLMARAGATDEAIGLAQARPRLGVGCHVVLADGQPVLPASQIASLLVKRTGHFPHSIARFLRRVLARRVSASEIEAEVRAQILFLQRKGIRLTHIDTHKHTHMFPTVLRAVLRAARACGIGAVRNPFEPAWAIAATRCAPWVRVAEVSALKWLEPVCRRIIAEEGFVSTDGTVAVAGTGVLNPAVVRELVKAAPPGTWELVTHPGYHDADLAAIRTRLRASRDVERMALETLREFKDVRLVSYAELAGEQAGKRAN